jgi:uncharacterized protein
MGVSLMTAQFNHSSAEKKKKIRSVVLKRSWFLFAIGLLLFNWWPGDILHFYGGYMHLAAFLLFIPQRYLLMGAILAIIIFHILLFIVPVETGWDLLNFKYIDFWTIKGFLRNTFYNGWNAIFPWFSYFLLGMSLGRADWQRAQIRKNVFWTGLTGFCLIEGLRLFSLHQNFDSKTLSYIYSDYIPPYLPFLIITACFALMVIAICVWIGNKFANSRIIHWLAITGSMTLSNYVFHLTVGMLIIQLITGKKYTGFLRLENAVAPVYIFFFAVAFFLLTMILNIIWSTKFKKGPLEIIMRKISA